MTIIKFPNNAHVAKNRAFIVMSGIDAQEFLQGQISNDMTLLENKEAIHGLLLTPQGKILADLFVYKYQQGFLLDIHLSIKDWLLSRFNMFKLRSQVEISDQTESFKLLISQNKQANACVSTIDPRFSTLNLNYPIRNIFMANSSSDLTNLEQEDNSYKAYLTAHAMIDFGADYQASEFFPQDLWFDKLGSISFNKGCYVGQEVVSRMRHKSTARKRLIPIQSNTILNKADRILLADTDKIVGEIISCNPLQKGFLSHAMLRVDKLNNFSKPLQNDTGNNLTIWRPEWIKTI